MIYKIVKNSFSVVAEARTWNSITFSNRAQAWLITEGLGRGTELKFEGNSLTLKYRNRQLRLSETYDDTNTRHVNGDTIHVFLEEDYSYLRDSGNVCVDIGANIGDSSIWLALNSFSHVIAVESYPQNFTKVLDNVNRNGLGYAIECFNKGLSSRKFAVILDTNAYVDGGYNIHEVPEGIPVGMTTLSELVSSLRDEKLCLKMDCEGCEYDTILNADPETLTKFSRIMIDYHYGYRDLEDKLIKCAFSFEHTAPHNHMNQNAAKKKMIIGYIYRAVRF